MARTAKKATDTDRVQKAEWTAIKTLSGTKYTLPTELADIRVFEETLRGVKFFMVEVDDEKLGVSNTLSDAYDKAIGGAVRKARRLVDWLETQVPFTTQGIFNADEKIIPTKTDDVITVIKEAAKNKPVESWIAPGSGITVTEVPTTPRASKAKLFVVRREVVTKPKRGRPKGSKNKPKK